MSWNDVVKYFYFCVLEFGGFIQIWGAGMEGRSTNGDGESGWAWRLETTSGRMSPSALLFSSSAGFLSYSVCVCALEVTYVMTVVITGSAPPSFMSFNNAEF